MQRSTNLNGRVVVVTGGGRGIGLATARALHRAGARVAIGDVDQSAAVAAASSIAADVFGAAMDVSDAASFQAFLALVEREIGPIDVLVNNAGIMPIGGFLEEPEATARRVFEVNVYGCINGMRLALPAMLARRQGHIVNVASAAGKSPVPGGASYGASKAAIVSLTETARVEFAGRGVSFTCVMPSFTATELISGTKGVRFIKTIGPEDVAKAIVAAIVRAPRRLRAAVDRSSPARPVDDGQEAPRRGEPAVRRRSCLPRVRSLDTRCLRRANHREDGWRQ